MAVQTLTCQGCGAQFVLPPQELTGACAYCGSNHVVRGSGQALQPDSILPMRLNQRQAVQALVGWVESQRIQPERKVQPPRGMYLPLWTFDIKLERYPGAATSSAVSATPAWTKSANSCRGKGIFFDDICVPGAPKLADLLPKIAASFPMNEAVPYDPRYLAGWPA